MGNSAEAGRKGGRVRSDCWVYFEEKDSGGLTVEVESIVGVMYGDSIKAQGLEALKALGIENGYLKIEDFGALPFVLAARMECAVKRALPDCKKEFLPEMAKHSTYTSTPDRFRRTRLYLPGNEPKFMVNAGLHHPDAVILDLEDAVAPSEKDAARFVIRNALRVLDFFGAERMVRINQGERGLEDLEYIVPHNVHLVLIPKCESAAQVQAVEKRVEEILAREGKKGPVFFMPIVESALACINAYEIASASPNVVSLAIGLEDYTADIGTQRTNEGTESFWARSQVVNAARAAGVQPIDTVFSDVGDMEGLKASVLEAKALGFDGKGCIHPRQIKIMHDAFAPSKKELDRAKKIVVAFEKADAEGLSAVSIGSKMIDPPVVKRALRSVKLAMMLGILDSNWRDADE